VSTGLYEDDIPIDLARAAHAGTSFDPETRAVRERTDYAVTLATDRQALEALARRAPDADAALARLGGEWPRYRTGYRRRFLVYLGRRSRCLSSMITGPSNFPTARNQKANDAERRAVDDMATYRERALAAIRKAIRPDLQPIASGDANAVERLREKLAKAREMQEMMKAANAAIRKHAKLGPDAQVTALVELGLNAGQARDLLKPDFCGRIGFADYETKNNGAEIRRLEGRLAGIERAKAEPDVVTDGVDGIRYEESPSDNRVRLFYPSKPALPDREALKRAGFRWAPTIGCWQAYRNTAAIAFAQRAAGIGGGK